MISVVIPLYNKEMIIEKSLKSVLSQDYDNFEVVIVNDGSTDRSVEFIKRIEDPRIHLIEQENAGPSKARNVGVKNARGEWILFLDADDELLPGALTRFYLYTQKCKTAKLFTCTFYVDNGKTKTKICDYSEGIIKNPFKEHSCGKLIPRAGTMLIDRELMLKYPFDEKIRRFEDLENLLKLYGVTKIYTFNAPSMIVNTCYAAASNGRDNIDEDFMGYLSLEGKSFWEQMCFYKLFIEQRNTYPHDCLKRYKAFYRRYDLYILYQLITRFNKWKK